MWKESDNWIYMQSDRVFPGLETMLHISRGSFNFDILQWGKAKMQNGIVSQFLLLVNFYEKKT